jgi:hypothetical protein
MPYSTQITRKNPSCLLFLIDQSASMGDNFASIQRPKSQAVADAVNKMLKQLVVKCSKSDGINDYYHVGVIGYGKDGAQPAFSGAIAGKDLVSISDIGHAPLRIEERKKKMYDGAGDLVDTIVKFPVWFDPQHNGGTPMTEAFVRANNVISTWLREHPDCYPPVVIHITDGESTDGSPLEEMRSLTSKSSSDGNVLLFNLHAAAKSHNPISFCGDSSTLPDQYAEILYNGSSVLPQFMKDIAKQEYDMDLPHDAKAFVINGDIDLIITAIEIGTRPVNLLR